MSGMGPGDSVSWSVPSLRAAYAMSLECDVTWKVTEQGMSHSGCQLWAPIQKSTAGPSAKEAATSQMLSSGWTWGPMGAECLEHKCRHTKACCWSAIGKRGQWGLRGWRRDRQQTVRLEGTTPSMGRGTR